MSPHKSKSLRKDGEGRRSYIRVWARFCTETDREIKNGSSEAEGEQLGIGLSEAEDE